MTENRYNFGIVVTDRIERLTPMIEMIIGEIELYPVDEKNRSILWASRAYSRDHVEGVLHTLTRLDKTKEVTTRHSVLWVE